MKCDNANTLQKILVLLRLHTGHDFTQYKKSAFTCQVDRRVAYYQLPDYEQYLSYISENSHETDILFHELLIGVTKFFRDTAAFEALAKKLVPVLKNKHDKEPIRVWVAGCSTGEEAYSIAIILIEYLETLKTKRTSKVQIFATDLDIDAIEFARIGLYHGSIVADVSKKRIKRFFIKINDCYQVKKELKELIVFSQHNLIKDTPFTSLDLISCRNVMIYLTADLKKKIIPVFYDSLNPKGILFQGPAETVGEFTDLFAPIELKHKLFERKAEIELINNIISVGNE